MGVHDLGRGTPVLPGSAIARSAIPAVPSRHLFFGSVKPLDFACSFGLRTSGNPQTLEVGGNTSTPTSLRVLFLDQVEGQKVEVGVILLRSIPLLSRALRDRQRLGGGPRVASLLSFAPKPPRGLGFGIVMDRPALLILVYAARVVDGDDSRDR